MLLSEQRISITAPHIARIEESSELAISGILAIEHLILNIYDLTPAINRVTKHAAIRPQIDIDGQQQTAIWGSNKFEIAPGKRKIVIYCLHKIYGKQMSRSLELNIQPGDSCTLDYTVQSNSSGWEAVLSINGQPDTTGLHVQTKAEVQREQRKYVSYKSVAAVVGLLMVPQLGSLGTTATLVAIGLALLIIYIIMQRSRNS